MSRSLATRLRLVPVAFIGALLVSACTDAAGESSDPAANSGGTVVASLADVSSTALVTPTSTSTSTSSTSSTSTSTTSTTVPTLSTIPHGSGPIVTALEGSPINPTVAATASAIYDAAIIRDYATIKAIIGDRRFRWGFVGQRRPAEEWQKEFDEGGPDALARIVALLDLPPAVDKRGNTVWPYLATKDPAEWNDQDIVALTGLGFRPEDIEATRFKGIYKDYRLIIGPDGVWTAFGVGY